MFFGFGENVKITVYQEFHYFGPGKSLSKEGMLAGERQTALKRERKKWLLYVGMSLAIAYLANAGCERFSPESTFKLADESRMPKWMKLPQGLSRTDVSLTMNYYVKVSGRSALFTLRDKSGNVLSEFYGKQSCNKPFMSMSEHQQYSAEHPAYEAITVDGVVEIIEHKKMEPIFYISDDAAIRKRFEEFGCE